MSKSALLKSSIAKKYWMALTGLFLCTFLIGHLLGNLQLAFKAGEEGRQAFNEYAYFMAHNPMIKILSYLTYFSILFHTVDGIMLTIKNRKSRPVRYAKNNANANSSRSSRNMALLGTLILVFIVTHMANFWYRAKISSEIFPLHIIKIDVQDQNGQTQNIDLYHTKTSPIPKTDEIIIKNKTELFDKTADVKVAEGYKDLHSLVFAFFGQNKSEYGFPKNNNAIFYTSFYVLSMCILAFHLWHGFSSAFQTVGINHSSYNSIIKYTGMIFSILIPLGFAIIPIMIFLKQI